MHFIFLGPGETGSWDVYLFWTQLALAMAAVASPFIAHMLASGREARASQDADRRLDRANREAIERERLSHKHAIERESLFHKKAEIRAHRERVKYAQIIFHGIQAEAVGIEGQVTKIKMIWQKAEIASKFTEEEMKVSVTPIVGDPSIWTKLVGRAQLDATIELLVRIRGHNERIRHVWPLGDTITPPVRDVIDKSIKQLEEALETLFQASGVAEDISN